MSERKMVAIKTIESKKDIPKADLIEVVQFGGWDCVVKKEDNFQVGQEVVYIEIDAFLPEGNPNWDFLMASNVKIQGGRRGHVLKTVRLRGQVSQGLVLPLSVLEGGDVESLGIEKYDPPTPACMRGLQKGLFPSFLRKTDAERIQNLELSDLIGKSFEVTEKLEGTSFTAYFLNEEEYGACSRNVEFKLSQENNHNLYVSMSNEINVFDLLADYYKREKKPICIQGEIIGHGIEKNIYQLNNKDVRFFNAFDPSTYSYLGCSERRALIESLGLKHVPVIEKDFYLNEDLTHKDLLTMAETKSALKDVSAEGLVFKCNSDPFLTFKVLNNKYMLKKKD